MKFIQKHTLTPHSSRTKPSTFSKHNLLVYLRWSIIDLLCLCWFVRWKRIIIRSQPEYNILHFDVVSYIKILCTRRADGWVSLYNILRCLYGLAYTKQCFYEIYTYRISVQYNKNVYFNEPSLWTKSKFIIVANCFYCNTRTGQYNVLFWCGMNRCE